MTTWCAHCEEYTSHEFNPIFKVWVCCKHGGGLGEQVPRRNVSNEGVRK